MILGVDGIVSGELVIALAFGGALYLALVPVWLAITANSDAIVAVSLRVDATEVDITRLKTHVSTLEDEMTQATNDITQLQNRTRNQSAVAGSTTFEGNMTIGTPLISSTTIYGTTTLNGDLLLSGMTVETINVRTIISNIQGNILDAQLNITNLQALTSNMTSVPNISTNFTGDLYLGGIVNVGTTIHQNVIDIQYLQLDLQTAKKIL